MRGARQGTRWTLVRGAILAGALLAAGCAVAVHPAPPPPRLLSAPEAVGIAAQVARSRGLVVDYTSFARLDRRARWHVEVGGLGGRDRARVVIDGYSGRVLQARLWGAPGAYGPAGPPPPGPPPVPGSTPEGAAPQGTPPPPPAQPPPPPPAG
jgi:hypothetical protein